MKKNYIAPTIREVKMRSHGLICTSPGDTTFSIQSVKSRGLGSGDEIKLNNDEAWTIWAR